MTDTIDIGVGGAVLFTVALVAPGHCGVCRRQIPADEPSLALDVANRKAMARVEICRPCIAERYPSLLEELDRLVEDV